MQNSQNEMEFDSAIIKDLKRSLEEARRRIEFLETKLALSESQNDNLHQLNCQLQTGKFSLFIGWFYNC